MNAQIRMQFGTRTLFRVAFDIRQWGLDRWPQRSSQGSRGSWKFHRDTDTKKVGFVALGGKGERNLFFFTGNLLCGYLQQSFPGHGAKIETRHSMTRLASHSQLKEYVEAINEISVETHRLSSTAPSSLYMFAKTDMRSLSDREGSPQVVGKHRSWAGNTCNLSRTGYSMGGKGSKSIS